MTNNWIGYVQRGYQEIKTSLLSRLGTTVPEITDRSESNIMIILLSMWAGLIEQINYYIDMMTRENFITTAKLFSSLIKLAKIYNYRVRLSTPAKVEVLISIINSTSGDPEVATNDVIIPAGTTINTSISSNYTYLTDADYTILAGNSYVWAQCTQHNKIPNITIGVVAGVANESLSLDIKTADLSLVVSINSHNYTFVDNFSNSTPTDKHFSTIIDEYGMPFIIFGDGINGAIVEAGDVKADYYITYGNEGAILENILTQISISPSTLPPDTELTSTNPSRSSGGVPIENIEILRKNLPLSLRTLNRAVTLNSLYNDFKDIAILSPNVYSADAVKSECGFLVDVYIVPYNGGIASLSQQTVTKNYIEERKVIGSVIRVHSAGEAELHVNINVTGLQNITSTQIDDAIKTLLPAAYNWKTRNIGDTVHLSDIIAMIDNLPIIDFLTLVNFYVNPYLNPTGINTSTLTADIITTASDSTVNWEIEYNASAGTYELFANGLTQGALILGTNRSITFDNDIFDIKLITLSPTPTGTVRWSFTLQPPNQDIDLTDHSVPVFYEENINLNITTT